MTVLADRDCHQVGHVALVGRCNADRQLTDNDIVLDAKSAIRSLFEKLAQSSQLILASFFNRFSRSVDDIIFMKVVFAKSTFLQYYLYRRIRFILPRPLQLFI